LKQQRTNTCLENSLLIEVSGYLKRSLSSAGNIVILMFFYFRRNERNQNGLASGQHHKFHTLLFGVVQVENMLISGQNSRIHAQVPNIQKLVPREK